MNNRVKTFMLLVSLILTSLPFPFLMHVSAMSAESLGSVTECKIVGDKIIVSGNIKHSVLVSNREASIAVYKLLPWENEEQVISETEPLKETGMSISFDFELPCLTIADKTSLYAVALIGSDGTSTCISSPKYPDAVTADTSDIGFKGVKTDNIAATLASHAGSAIVDVYLDKLDNGNKSGHIFNADGDIYYFDRDFIKDLDKQILSYTAMGCEVLLRFLISPGITDIPFCSDGRIWSTNKCVVVDNLSALNAIYGYTYYLMSRYDGGEYGSVSGIILGRGVDMPILYNYASLVSEDYETVYARSLALIGLAATDAAGDGNISLVVPVGDSLTERGGIYAERFLSSVADYIALHSELKFTVMCESTHNPYHVDDYMFSVVAPPDETGEDGEIIVYPDTDFDSSVTDVVSEESLIEDTSVFETDEAEITLEYIDGITENCSDITGNIDVLYPDETCLWTDGTEYPEETILEPEKVGPYINTREDGYYCTDSIDMFLETFGKLKKKYSSLNKGFAWCWYPNEDTIEGSLGVCYSYNYMKLASENADFFVVAFEGIAQDRFHSISHLFKYIDTSGNIKETEHAREIFGIKDWSDIIAGHVSSTGVFNVFAESELQPNIMDFVGTLKYMDYTSTNNTGNWYEGIFCNSIIHQTDNGEGFLQADFNLDEARLDQAEIGCIFKTPEPLLLGDALTFDLMCGENDGSLYEISAYINCGSNTIVSKAVIAGGVRSSLSVDVKELYNAATVKSIRISLTRITGSGNCNFNLYSVSLNSKTLDDDALNKSFHSIRNYLRSDPELDSTKQARQMAVTVVLLSSVGLFFVLFAFANDRRLFKNVNADSKSIQNEKE